MIAIGILFVLSFPPVGIFLSVITRLGTHTTTQLFGAGFVALLCGAIWGAGVGFGIVVAGQFLGELGNFL